MRYISTRGLAPILGFEDTLFEGLANDGGLYVPEYWPTLDINTFRGLDYIDTATKVLENFVSKEISNKDLMNLIKGSYTNFSLDGGKEIAPLIEISKDFWLLQLYNGPTLAFKDFALQLLGKLFEFFLSKSKKDIVILGATSGDTGSAAIEAFKGKNNIKIVILHPYGRVSSFQRKQMTTVSDENVFNLAINGTFDDCQFLVKELFKNRDFRLKANLAAVNSINIARVIIQTVYFIYSYMRVLQNSSHINFSVPTGNFGNIFAGYIAQEMGLKKAPLVLATNKNDILSRFFNSGKYIKNEVFSTISPSMDIQVASNFERYMFDLLGRDSKELKNKMEIFDLKGSLTVSDSKLSIAKKRFVSGSLGEQETLKVIRKVYKDSGVIIDPHTAVAVGVMQSFYVNQKNPAIVMSTAHPAKFSNSVKKALGVSPKIPEKLSKVLHLKERYVKLKSDTNVVKDYIENNVLKK